MTRSSGSQKQQQGGAEAAPRPRKVAASATHPREEWLGLTGNVDVAPMGAWTHRLREWEAIPQPVPVGQGIKLHLTAAAARKRLPRAKVIESTNRLILRQEVVEAALATVDATGILQKPVPIRSQEGELLEEHGWIVLEPEREWPLDRAACQATYHHESNPQGSFLRRLGRVGFGPAMAPPVAAFRVFDAPGLVAWRADVVLALRQQAGSSLVLHLDFSDLLCAARIPASDQTEPFAPAEVAAGAAEALRRVLAGEAEAREAACASPLQALILACCVDRAATALTRRAALCHPHSAALYAWLVEHVAQDDTRTQAARDRSAALFYAERVDQALRPETVAALLAGGWTEEDLATLGLPRTT